jgi:hypothetical protein
MDLEIYYSVMGMVQLGALGEEVEGLHHRSILEH